MNGAAPPPGILAPPLGPLALNLKNAILRKNTNARLAALNSIGVSPPEKNLPRLSNLAPFPVPEPVLAQPSRLSAKSSNWSPARPPLPPPPPPPPPLPIGPPPMASYLTTPYTMPSYTAPVSQPALSPQMLIEFMLQGGRVYINNYPPYLHDKLNEIMRQYKYEYSISQHYRDGNSPSTNPYYFIRTLRSVGQTKRHRQKRRKTKTRRHR
jgi:hypothetical protein